MTTVRGKTVVFCALLLSLLSFPRLRAAVVDVWAVGDGEKVFRYDADHPSKKSERYLGRQPDQPERTLQRSAGFPSDRGGGQRGCGCGRNNGRCPPAQGIRPGCRWVDSRGLRARGTIEVFSQHYIQVTTPTPPSWIYGSAAAAPARMAGWIPDALIPVDAKPGTGGFPMDIPPTPGQRFQKMEQDRFDGAGSAGEPGVLGWTCTCRSDRSFPREFTPARSRSGKRAGW